MFKRDWATSWNIVNYSIVNNEHDWEDPFIQLKRQQMYNFNNHN